MPCPALPCPAFPPLLRFIPFVAGAWSRWGGEQREERNREQRGAASREQRGAAIDSSYVPSPPPPSLAPPPAAKKKAAAEKEVAERPAAVEEKVKVESGEEVKIKASSNKVHIPLVGVGEYGVWKAQVSAESVGELRDYLQKHWSEEGCKLPIPGGSSDLFSYGGFHLTSAEFDSKQQARNTLRWSHKGTRYDSILDNLPGFRGIKDDVDQLILERFPELAAALGGHNGHIIRQFFEADGGSGFSRHQDLADDAHVKIILYLSVLVKLTDDPPGGTGTWMQVEGFEPVRYGAPAGSVVMFCSRRPHWSLRTPRNMGKVLKLALFYSFVDTVLRKQYESCAPPLLNHDDFQNRDMPGLPPSNGLPLQVKGAHWVIPFFLCKTMLLCLRSRRCRPTKRF